MFKTTFLCLIIISIISSCKTNKLPLYSNYEQLEKIEFLDIGDICFIKNRYFFFDTYYQAYFDSGLVENDPLIWHYKEEMGIVEFDIYISTNLATSESIKGISTVNPENYVNIRYSDLDTVIQKEGTTEKGFYKRLIKGIDYGSDIYRGFFWLNKAVSDLTSIGVAYKTQDKIIGTLFSDLIQDTTKSLVTRLVKAKNMLPEYNKVWPLMMRNVYFLGDSLFKKNKINLHLFYNDKYKNPLGSERSFSTLMGLDLLDENGMYRISGDGFLDNNPLLLNKMTGSLIFPSIQPFDPPLNSRYSFDNNYRADIYGTKSQAELEDNSKFNLVFEYSVN